MCSSFNIWSKRFFVMFSMFYVGTEKWEQNTLIGFQLLLGFTLLTSHGIPIPRFVSVGVKFANGDFCGALGGHLEVEVRGELFLKEISAGELRTTKQKIAAIAYTVCRAQCSSVREHSYGGRKPRLSCVWGRWRPCFHFPVPKVLHTVSATVAICLFVKRMFPVEILIKIWLHKILH